MNTPPRIFEKPEIRCVLRSCNMSEPAPIYDESSKNVLEGLDAELAAQLPTFEQFFKTFGFKRVHGRIWGLLVLIGRPLSAKEIAIGLSLSQGATSQALNELTHWGAIT